MNAVDAMRVAIAAFDGKPYELGKYDCARFVATYCDARGASYDWDRDTKAGVGHEHMRLVRALGRSTPGTPETGDVCLLYGDFVLCVCGPTAYWTMLRDEGLRRCPLVAPARARWPIRGDDG